MEEMDMAHAMFIVARGGSLFTAPINDGTGRQKRRILDVGTGTGIWAIEVAE